ncbi:glycosyltransferase [Duganella sp. sic0402]|uniref:glycosyltransferase family 2 protein n=1 Tax=Duganella sp. sic0402 TaxID=2854786 RepID=UPI001C441528|nr:glycosyltransferase family 2 protein [Duganella sp. sic0402]MBV7539224.1 glycosyltransferase [Duganella sp. sic0402]
MFTVIITTHDRPLLLKRTLASLIAQTCQDFKVVVVSDSGTYLPPYEELSQLSGRFDYVLRCSGEAGPAASRNMGLDIASGEYIVFIDDDDTFEPEHFARFKQRLLVDRPEILFCDFQVRFEDRAVYPPTFISNQSMSIAGATFDSIYVRNTIPNSCLAYRADVVKGVRTDTTMRIYEDWDFLLAAMHGRSLVHLATDTVVIHKTPATAPENMRRGNTREDLTLPVMLELYRRHAAPNMETRLARQALLASADIHFDLSHF